MFPILFIFLLVTIGPRLWADPEESITLPPPEYSSKVSLEEAIYKRRSVRSFMNESLTLSEISQLLWAAGGKTIDGVTGPSRSYPSAGGIYPLEIYLVVGKIGGLQQGIYKYYWRDHNLKMVKQGDYRNPLARAALKQSFIEQAPVTIVLTVFYRKTSRVYGKRGTMRYVPMDAGHAAQNISLQAVAMGLGSVPVGAFDDRSVKKLLNLSQEDPLYLIPVGRPSHD